MQYPSKKAKRKAEYMKRKAQKEFYKNRDANLQRAVNGGSIEEMAKAMAKAMGIKLK